MDIIKIVQETTHGQRLWFALTIVALAGGGLLAWWLAVQTDQEMRADLLQETRFLAQTVNMDRFQKLTGTASDVELPEYLRFKEQFGAVCAANLQYRFVYLIGRRNDGTVFFFVDNEPVGSADESPAGMVYDDVPAGFLRVLETGVAAVEGPFTDQWGSFVSGCVPLTDPESGEVVAALAIDFDARDWNWEVFAATALPVGLFTIAMLLLLIAGSRLTALRDRTVAVPPYWLRRPELLLTVAVGLLLTLLVAWMVHSKESDVRKRELATLAEGKTTVLAQTLYTLRDKELGGLAQFYGASENVTKEEFYRYTKSLTRNPAVQMWGWVPYVSASEKDHFEETSRVSVQNGFEIWQQNAAGEREPAVGREAYYPLFFASSPTGKESALGFDLGSGMVSLAALEEARRTGLPTAAEFVALGEKTDTRKGMLLVQSVFDNSNPGHVKGFVVAMLRLDKVLAGIDVDGLMDIGFSLVDRHGRYESLAVSWSVDPPPASGLTVRRPILAFGRVFVITAYAGPGFLRLHPASAFFITILVGSLLTSLLALLMAVVLRRREALEELVLKRTAALRMSEEYLAATLHSIGEGVIACDCDGSVTSLNRMAETLTGWSMTEARGMPIQEVFRLTNMQTREAVPNLIERALCGGVSVDLANHTVLIARSGSEYQIALVCTPIRDAAGGLIGAVLVFRDVTEECRQRDELRRVKAAVDSVGDAIAMATPEGRHFYQNEAFTRLFGYSLDEVAQLSPAAFYVNIEDAITSFQTVMDGNSWQGEIEMFARDGRVIHVQLHSDSIKDSEGKSIGFIGIHTDITKRKEAEKALAEERKRLDFIMEVTGTNIDIMDEDFNLVYVDSGWQKVYGDPHGRKCYEYFMGQDTPCLPCGVHKAMESHEVVVSEVFLPQQSRTFEVHTIPFQNDKGERLFAEFNVDITVRKQSEAALRESEARYRELVESANSIILRMDPEGRVVFFNEFAQRFFGYQPDEILGKNVVGTIIPETDSTGENLQNLIVDIGRHPEHYRVNENENMRRDGTRVWISWTNKLLYDRAGRVREILCIGNDITGLKQADKALQESNRQLEASTARANLMAEKAEMANLAKSEFLANMSHEIRTPMNGVIGMTGLLLDTELNEEQRHYAGIIKASGESLMGLLNDILDFSKIEAGKMELETLNFDLQSLLDDFTVALALRAHDKGLELFCAADPAVPTLLAGDPGRLRQVLNNLVGNAIKFTHQGQVVVRVAVDENAECGMMQEDFSVMLRFSVRDTGIGVPEDKIGMLFDKFTQVDASTTRKYGGTGLGLAISKQLVALMDGKIGVVTEEGKGSEFWFTACFGRQAETGQAAAMSPAELCGVHVLIVDDNATSREILKNRLSSLGMRPEEISDGPGALQALYRALDAGDPFRVAVIDMQMPGMDGEALGRAINADIRLANTCLVMLTSIGASGDARRFREIGFAAYATKPIRYEELKWVLAQALAGNAGMGATPRHMVTRHTAREAIGLFAGCKARILLAEDNITNQQVALAMLKQLGLTADVAANGYEAIAALKTLPYDLVFMDIQMPEMDGLEATRQIRNFQSATCNQAVPIIAMTAHAKPGDQDKCMEAGMNDYVAKPVTRAALVKTLKKWLPKIGEKDEMEVKDEAEANAAYPLPDVQPSSVIFDRAGMLERLSGDEELAGVILETFMEDIPLRIRALRDAVEKGDVATTMLQTHTIKGSAANVGCEVLRAVAFEMENKARSGDLDTVRDRMAALEEAFERIKQAIRET